jgi:hypothetical protein
MAYRKARSRAQPPERICCPLSEVRGAQSTRRRPAVRRESHDAAVPGRGATEAAATLCTRDGLPRNSAATSCLTRSTHGLTPTRACRPSRGRRPLQPSSPTGTSGPPRSLLCQLRGGVLGRRSHGCRWASAGGARAALVTGGGRRRLGLAAMSALYDRGVMDPACQMRPRQAQFILLGPDDYCTQTLGAHVHPATGPRSVAAVGPPWWHVAPACAAGALPVTVCGRSVGAGSPAPDTHWPGRVSRHRPAGRQQVAA